jgi:hypothetical protein
MRLRHVVIQPVDMHLSIAFSLEWTVPECVLP